MNRFSIGNLARVKYVRSGHTDFWTEGAIVEIVKVCINTMDYSESRYDYIVRMFNGGKAFPIDNQLEPLDSETILSQIVNRKQEPIQE